MTSLQIEVLQIFVEAARIHRAWKGDAADEVAREAARLRDNAQQYRQKKRLDPSWRAKEKARLKAQPRNKAKEQVRRQSRRRTEVKAYFTKEEVRERHAAGMRRLRAERKVTTCS